MHQHAFMLFRMGMMPDYAPAAARAGRIIIRHHLVLDSIKACWCPAEVPYF